MLTDIRNTRVENTESSSSAAAVSKNEVDCLAFCSGSSNASAGAASSSKTNSPTTKIITVHQHTLLIKPTVATLCNDNTGSEQDNGYAQGYSDGQRDWHGFNNHGFDDSIHHGSKAFKSGYKD